MVDSKTAIVTWPVDVWFSGSRARCYLNNHVAIARSVSGCVDAGRIFGQHGVALGADGTNAESDTDTTTTTTGLNIHAAAGF